MYTHGECQENVSKSILNFSYKPKMRLTSVWRISYQASNLKFNLVEGKMLLGLSKLVRGQFFTSLRSEIFLPYQFWAPEVRGISAISVVSLLLYATVPFQEWSHKRNLIFLFEGRIRKYASTLSPTYRNTDVMESEVLRPPFLKIQSQGLLNYSSVFLGHWTTLRCLVISSPCNSWLDP